MRVHDGFKVAWILTENPEADGSVLRRRNIPAYPYTVAMEAAMLAPKAEVSIFPLMIIEWAPFFIAT